MSSSLRAALVGIPLAATAFLALQGCVTCCIGDDCTIGLFGCDDAFDRLQGGSCGDLDGDDVAGQALAAVNLVRDDAGLDPIELSDALVQAAQAHAEYMWLNRDDETWAHDEVEGNEGFTGESIGDRAAAAGYHGAVGEIIHYYGHPDIAIPGWLSTVYHRNSMLDPTTTVMGYGRVCEDAYQVDVADFGFDDDDTAPALGLHPSTDASNIGTEFSGESPDPLEGSGLSYPVGYPVSVHYHPELAVELVDMALGYGSQELELLIITPDDDVQGHLDHELFGVPVEPLPSGEELTWDLELIVDGASERHQVRFTAE